MEMDLGLGFPLEMEHGEWSATVTARTGKRGGEVTFRCEQRWRLSRDRNFDLSRGHLVVVMRLDQH